MPKITDKPRNGSPETIVIRTAKNSGTKGPQPYQWWNANSKAAKVSQLMSTVAFLKNTQDSKFRNASLHCKLYQNQPLMGAAGISSNFGSGVNTLPVDRPTMNVIQSCIDTMVSRISQSRPRPVFLTDNSDYKQRKTAKDLNSFINGEFYRCKAYDLTTDMLRDAFIMGPGVIKIVEGQDKKVQLERRLFIELLADHNESLWRKPRQMYEIQLVDRSVLKSMFPEKANAIDRVGNAYPETSSNSSSIADMLMVVEAYRLPSGPDAGDGEKIIACGDDIELYSSEWKKNYFPYEIYNYSERVLGLWGQGIAEQLMGTQAEINKLLSTISKSINLVGVPRVFVEDGSKVVKAHLNNEIGAIITYRGTKPSYEIANCVPGEIYAQLQRLIEYAFQQSGVSALAAASQKPAGLNSGEAIRNFDDLQTDRFASTVRKWDNAHVSLAYKMFDLAVDIAERDGKYSTIYPNKNGVQKIDLPNMGDIKDTFVIQCYDASSLPRDPAGRLQKVTEMIQSGMVDIKEGRRLLDFPDLEQMERLANSAEERLFQILDKIVEDGKYNPPDPYLNPPYAHEVAIQYYNLYMAANLPENKAEMLRTFIIQCETLMQAAMAPQPGQAPGPQAGGGSPPMAAPQPLQQSPLVPNGGIQ